MLVLCICVRVQAMASTLVMDVNIALPFVEFVAGEPVTMTVSVKNNGESVFIVDDYPPFNQNSMAMFVRTPRGRMALPKTKHSILQTCTIKPGDTHTFTVDINDFYDLRTEGIYQVSVAVLGGKESVGSYIVPFTIVKGIEMGSVQRLNKTLGRVYKYQLIYWARNQQEHLFLKIIDQPTGSQYGFLKLGTVVRIADPKILFEDNDVVAVIHQTLRDQYIRTRIDMSMQPPRVISGTALTSVVAIQEAMSTERAAERWSEAQRVAPKEDKGGFFGRHSTRSKIPASGTETQPGPVSGR